MQQTISDLENFPDYYGLGEELYKHYPRITRAAYNPYHPRADEIKKVEAYVRQEMADFDVTKHRHTLEEKHRLVSFIDQCRREIAPALVIHVLFETRGAQPTNYKVNCWLVKIHNWRKYFKDHEFDYNPHKKNHLSEKRKAYDKRQTKVNRELLREAILAIGSSAPRFGYAAMWRYYLELERVNKPDFSMAFPRVYTIIKEIIAADKNLQIYLKKGKDGLLQRYPVGVKIKHHVNEEWQVDSTKIDFLVKVPDSSAPKGYVVKRKNLSAVIETYGGGAYAKLVDSTNSNAQIEVLVSAMEKMGKPDKVRSDNGSDYASKHYQGFLARCGISSMRCSPYHGREKGKIERFFGVLHGWLYFIPGYIGNDVAKRQQIENQRASKADTLSGKATRIPEDELLFDYDLQIIFGVSSSLVLSSRVGILYSLYLYTAISWQEFKT